MQRVLSREQLRRFDQLASDVCGVSSLVLMENAGRGAADYIARTLVGERARAPRRVVVVCGAGNNAGDGYVVARRLRLLGLHVELFAAAAEGDLRGDALSNYRAWVGCGGDVEGLEESELTELERALCHADAVVDALFGSGLNREVTGLYRAVIERLNAAPCRRFALDLPSGLDANTGAVHGLAVRAELTLTFAAHKLGLLTPNGCVYGGRVELLDIGVPPSALPDVGQSAWLVARDDLRSALPPRAANAHKASAGRVLVLAGSPGKVGAALLVAQGALRAGAGLVTVAGLPALVEALDQRVMEVMTARLDASALEASLAPLLQATDVVAVGPGLGLDAVARQIVEHVVLEHPGLVVVDADAISHFKGRATDLARARGPRILTPHPGEMGRLIDASTATVEGNRFSALDKAVTATRACVLLKGPRTLVGVEGELPLVTLLGSPVLATGGAGDTLTGIIAALGCHLDAFRAAWVGACVHARAGELWAQAEGADRGLLAREIADWVPRAIADLSAATVALPS